MSVRPGLVLLVVLALAAAAPAHAVQPSQTYALDPHTTGLLVEDVRFTSSGDSVALGGWWFAGRPNMPTVVLFPRGTGNMADLVPSVIEFSRRGFAVMTFDLRDFGPGGPGGVDSLRDIVFASRWVNDAEGACAFARRRAGGQPVFAWGQDLGAPLALAVAGRKAGDVDGIVVEGLFHSAQEELLWLGTSQNPETVRRHRVLVNAIDDPVSAVSRMRTPMMVVVAMKDDVTPPDVTRQVANASMWTTETWVIPDAKHDGTEKTPGYYDRVAAWLTRTTLAVKRRRH